MRNISNIRETIKNTTEGDTGVGSELETGNLSEVERLVRSIEEIFRSLEGKSRKDVGDGNVQEG
jgi:hypothetical protein